MVDHDMGAIRGIPKDLIDASRQILENEPIETGKNINPAGIHFPEAEKEEEELVEGPEKHSTGDKESYRDFVNKALKKFGVDSPAELSGDKKKEFYDYLDKNWIGDHEKDDPKAEAKDDEKEDQVHTPKKALEPMSSPNGENGKKKKKIKPEKVNTNPSMDGQEQSKRPILVRER